MALRTWYAKLLCPHYKKAFYDAILKGIKGIKYFLSMYTSNYISRNFFTNHNHQMSKAIFVYKTILFVILHHQLLLTKYNAKFILHLKKHINLISIHGACFKSNGHNFSYLITQVLQHMPRLHTFHPFNLTSIAFSLSTMNK